MTTCLWWAPISKLKKIETCGFFHWLAKSMEISFHLKISKIGQWEAEICQKMWEKTQNLTFCYHSQLWSAGEEKAGNVIQLPVLFSSRYDGIYMRGTTSKMPQLVAGFGMLIFGLMENLLNFMPCRSYPRFDVATVLARFLGPACIVMNKNAITCMHWISLDLFELVSVLQKFFKLL